MDHEHAEQLAADAITIERCRKLLGDEADGLSDHEIDHIRRHADAIAHVIVEMFLERRAAQEQQSVSRVPITLPHPVLSPQCFGQMNGWLRGVDALRRVA
jgi:hypothetical protein